MHSPFNVKETLDHFKNEVERGFSPIQKDAFEGMSCKSGAQGLDEMMKAGADLVSRSILPDLTLHN